MSSILVSGLFNMETTVKIRGFPISYYPIDYDFFGVASSLSGVGFNLTKCTRYTQSCCTTKFYGRFTTFCVSYILTHICHLITAVNVGQDMTTGNLHSGVATYGASLPVPFYFSFIIFVGIIT